MLNIDNTSNFYCLTFVLFGITTFNLSSSQLKTHAGLGLMVMLAGHESVIDQIMKVFKIEIVYSLFLVKQNCRIMGYSIFYTYRGMKGKFPEGVPEKFSKGVRD